MRLQFYTYSFLLLDSKIITKLIFLLAKKYEIMMRLA